MVETPAKTSTPSVNRLFPAPLDLLVSEPYQFDFFQSVRLLGVLGRLRSRQEGMRTKRPIGLDYQPTDEIVRFRALVSHAFPGSPIESFQFKRATGNRPLRAGPPEMTITFMGMTGPSGVLPQHYTQTLIERVRLKDFSLRDFLDLFHHRLISQFYRVWEKYHFPIGYEAAALDPGAETDVFTQCMYCLVGQGTRGLRRRLELSDETFLYFSGQFAHFPPNAVSLERLLAEYFGLAVQVNQFQGQWLQLTEADQTRMASGGLSGSANNALGKTSIAGRRVWSTESKFRIRLGPLPLGRFRKLLPSGKELMLLAQFVRRFVGPALDFDIQPILLQSDISSCRLGGDGDASQLGWNTWICSKPMTRHGDDAVFYLEGAPLR